MRWLSLHGRDVGGSEEVHNMHSLNAGGRGVGARVGAVVGARVGIRVGVRVGDGVGAIGARVGANRIATGDSGGVGA